MIEDIPKVQQFDAMVYFSAFLFQQSCFHGVPLVKEVTCPKCNKVIKTTLTASASMVKIDIAMLMRQYKSVSDRVSFESFLDLTFPEYKVLLDLPK